MMERVGVDPGLAIRKAEQAFSAASLSCLDCLKFKECRTWLNQKGGNIAPRFCPNAPFFDSVRLRR